MVDEQPQTPDFAIPEPGSDPTQPVDRPGPSSLSIQRLFSTIPETELALYSDLIDTSRVDLAIKQPFDLSPPRRPVVSQIYDDSTPWFEAADASFMLGLISRSYRRAKIAFQNQIDPNRTQIELEDIDRFFEENGANIPDSLRRRKVQGRYDGIGTKEAMIKLMAHDLTMDLYQEKVDKGSIWATGFATGVDIALIEVATLGALGAAPLVGRGVVSVGGAVARTASKTGVRSGMKLTKTASRAATIARMPARTGQSLRANRSRQLTKALVAKRSKTAAAGEVPVEGAATIGTHASQTGSSVADSTNILARAWGFNSVKGATAAGGGIFVQEAGIKLLDDVRTWGEIAQDTALAAAAGGVIGFAVPFTTNIIRSFGDDAAKAAEKAAKASNGVKPILGVTSKIRINEAGVIIADVSERLTLDPKKIFTADLFSSFLRNPITLVGMKFERMVGRILITGGIPEKVAQFWASIARPLLWGGSIYGIAAAFGLAPSNFGAEGMADKMKQIIAKEVSKKIKGQDDQVSLPIGDPTELLAIVAPDLDLDITEEQEQLLEQVVGVDTDIAQGVLPSPPPLVAAELDFPEGVDRTFFDASVALALDAAQSIENFTLEEALVDINRGFDALEQEIRDDPDIQKFVGITAELALNAHTPLAETFLLAAGEINQFENTPEELREFAAAYRNNAADIMLGDTIGDILLDQSYRVAEEHTLIDEQAELERRIMNEIGHIDQTFFTGSLDENGLAAAGNMTSRILANTFATFLEAKADGTLSDEIVRFRDDPAEWMRNTSASSLEKFAMKMQVQQMTSINWIGRHIDGDDAEKFTQETMLMAYSTQATNRLVSDELTPEDEDVISGLNYTYMANFLSTYQTILFENVSGQQDFRPPQKDIHRVKNTLSVPVPVPAPVQVTDVPEFTEPLLADVPTDIPSFEP